MKSKILDRPMFKKPVDETDVENVGIMQGFMDEEADDDLDYEKYMQEEEGDDDESDMASVMDRRPNSPEILMNNLRGDMRSVDARVEELAELVGYNAAADTPPDVLALLQPVLAQGIGSMPAEQALGQPMPPAPQGGMPSAPPGGMAPPMGMPPGPMPEAQGPGAPVAMANGGYVQRFSDGTDEDGVTPMNDTSSYNYPAELTAAAQSRVYRSLLAQPMAVPDLEAEVAKRAPLYEKVLGVDPKQSQAQMLFELGNRAFNYAANVDDQGNRLRGSQAARLAGAVRTLPGAIGGITAQMEKEKRAVKAAALQATEKDVQAIREQNAKLVEGQRKSWSEIYKASVKGNIDKGFGTGLEGMAQNTLYKYAPDYANGTLSPELTRKFESALTIVTQPTQYTDPYTGNTVTKTPQIPAYVTAAVSARKNLAGISPKVKAPNVEMPMEQDQLAPGDTSYLDNKNLGPKINVDEFNQPTADKATAAPVVVPKPGTPVARSIWGSADLIAGPVSSITARVSRIPGLGNIAPDVLQARSYVTTAVNDLVSNLRTNDRFSETERKEIKSQIDIGPEFFDNPSALKNRIIGISDFLEKKIQEEQSKIQDKNLPVKIRQSAADRLVDLQVFSTTFGVPVRVYSLEQVQALQKGTPFLWNGTEPRTRQ